MKVINDNKIITKLFNIEIGECFSFKKGILDDDLPDGIFMVTDSGVVNLEDGIFYGGSYAIEWANNDVYPIVAELNFIKYGWN